MGALAARRRTHHPNLLPPPPPPVHAGRCTTATTARRTSAIWSASSAPTARVSGGTSAPEGRAAVRGVPRRCLAATGARCSSAPGTAPNMRSLALAADFDLCLECFATGVEIQGHRSDHRYRMVDNLSFPLYHPDWGVSLRRHCRRRRRSCSSSSSCCCGHPPAGRLPCGGSWATRWQRNWGDAARRPLGGSGVRAGAVARQQGGNRGGRLHIVGAAHAHNAYHRTPR
jgi:hypothetical protein